MRTSFMIRRWWIVVITLASLRLAHINLLWADEDYHLAAAIQILNGHLPYRDFWYDKPPLSAFFYLLIQGHAGWPLRILDVLFVLACCFLAYLHAKSWWGEKEGATAALLLAFFTTFYLPSATIPFAVDGLMLLPHLAAIYFAFNGRALYSGLCCALALLTNVKAVFVVATCGIWLWRDLPMFAVGVSVPLTITLGLGFGLGLLRDAYQQIWLWGFTYAASSTSLDMAIRRCADWLAFHAALVVGLVMAQKEPSFRLVAWFLLSTVPIFMGDHFAPRYFFQLLPFMVTVASRGIMLGLERFGRTGVVVLAVTLIVPVARFGPRYLDLIRDNLLHKQTSWTDVALDVDSQHVADLINKRKKLGDTLFVWGYRPDIYVYSHLVPPGKFSDSQPLDAVPADRHFMSHQPVSGIDAKSNRANLIGSAPTFLVDGLGLLNSDLKPQQFADLQPWLQNYRLIATTKLSKVYMRSLSMSSRD